MSMERIRKYYGVPAKRGMWHSTADELLCELLSTLGYPQTVEAFRELSKWYE